MQHLPITNEQIDISREEVTAFLEKAGTDHASVIRTAISVEEILLDYQSMPGEEATFSLRCRKVLGRPRIELQVFGREADPFAKESEENRILNHLLANMGRAPVWRYRGGANVITFMLPKKRRKPQTLLLASILLAVVSGLAFRFLSPDLGLRLDDALLQPLFNMVAGLLSAVSGPLIFLSICWGICSIGDVSTLNHIGKRMLRRFFLMIVFSCLFTAVLALPFIPLQGSGGSSRLQISPLIELLQGIFPDNVLNAFVTNHPLQIIFIAVFVGLALLILGSKIPTVTSFVEEGNSITLLIMEQVTGLLPLLIFTSIFHMIITTHLGQLKSAYRLALFLLLIHVLILILPPMFVMLIRRVRPRVLLRKLMPPFLIILTTASSAAGFPLMLKTCKEKLGIDKGITDFGIPLGRVLYMPSAAAFLFAAPLFMAQAYDIPVTPTFLISDLLLSVLMSFAIPPIPGGDVGCYSLMFLQLGIPLNSLAVVMTLSMLFEFLGTATDMTSLQCEMVHLTSHLGKLDLDQLRRDSTD